MEGVLCQLANGTGPGAEKELDHAQLTQELTGRPETTEIEGETVKVNVGED